MQTLTAEIGVPYGPIPTDRGLDPAVFSRAEWFALFLVGVTVMIGCMRWMLQRHIGRVDRLENACATFQTKEDSEVKYTALAGLLGEIRAEGNTRETRIMTAIGAQRDEAREDHRVVRGEIAKQSDRIDDLFKRRVQT